MAGGYCATLFALTGDLDYFGAILDLPKHSLVSGPCMYCRATGAGAATWTNFGEDAPWRGTLWSPSEWRMWEHRSRCPLFTLPGASCWTAAYDWMHSKYLGCDMYLFGSVMSILCHIILPGTPEENVAQCWDFLKNYFKVHRTKSPFRYLTKLSMFVRKGKFPKLRGKAAEVRHFCAALQALWQANMNKAIKIHREIDLMLRYNVHCENILTEFADEFSLPPGPAHDFEKACRSMFILQNQVATHFLEEGMQYFDVTSKSHFVQHLSMLAPHVSPRLIWAFRGEDLMKKLQTLAQSCTRGNSQVQTNLKMCRHYRVGLHLRFYAQDQG